MKLSFPFFRNKPPRLLSSSQLSPSMVVNIDCVLPLASSTLMSLQTLSHILKLRIITPACFTLPSVAALARPIVNCRCILLLGVNENSEI